jgi:VWFA-related protein
MDPRLLPLLLIGLAPVLAAQAPAPYQISVNVHLVVLNASVRDAKGRVVPELREQDFQVYEDGVRQDIRLFLHEDIPVTVGLVVDHSGSMRPKLQHVIAAVRTFVQSSSPEDEMFVVNFNEKVTLGLPDAIPLSNHPEELARAISSTPATGKTALYDAIAAARGRLLAGSRDKKVLIVISDGGDNASSHSLVDVLKMAEQSGVLVYTIGIFDPEDEDRNPAVLRRLAGETGGEAFFPGDLDEVVTVCERIARDIRNQYTIGYVSSNASQSEAWRAIKVIAAGEGKSKLVVRTRSGYVPKNEAPH